MPKCRYCEADIIWARSTDPKSTAPIPLDARPTTAFRRTGPELAEPVQVHLNHCVTCKKRDEAAKARDARKKAERQRTEAQQEELEARIGQALCDCQHPARSTHPVRGTVCTACKRRIRSLDDCCSGCGNTYRSPPCGDVHRAIRDRLTEIQQATGPGTEQT